MPLGRPVYNPSPAIQSGYLGGSLRSPTGAETFHDWQDVIARDPNLSRLRQQSPESATNYLRAAYGLGTDYKLNAEGQLVDSHNFLMRNLWWLGPAAVVGGGLAGALTGPGAAGTGVGAGVADKIYDHIKDKATDKAVDTATDKVVDSATGKVTDKVTDKVVDKGFDWLESLLKIGGPLLGGLGEGLLTQKRQSFQGTGADPANLLAGVGGKLQGFESSLMDRMAKGPNLEHATVGSLPTFTGGGLPSPVGVLPDSTQGVRRKAVTAPGNPADDVTNARMALSLLGLK
jgi:hypothetical protein